ncbi:MAG: chorismate-binding protein, partial [Oscillospiraceae bacterium]|nr:chorismate-binding protein [Oscillospiraceae bacterium]
MVYPDLETIRELAKDYRVIPVCRELYADLVTPIALLRKLAARSERYFLLESVEGGERWGRYTFLGCDPAARVVYRGGKVILEDEDGSVTEIQTDRPFDFLREFMTRYRGPKLPGMPPFTGGLVGCFGYGLAAVTEPALRLKTGGAADFDLLLFDKVIAYDHLRQKLTLVDNMKTENVELGWATAMRNLDRLQELTVAPLPPVTEPAPPPAFTSAPDKEAFCARVEQIKQHIIDGDIFQAVLSRRFTGAYRGGLTGAYRVLRTTNPSPYMVCMRIDGYEVISTSPETLVRLQNRRLSTFPVAGSRPRGKTPAEDAALEEELLNDPKE